MSGPVDSYGGSNRREVFRSLAAMALGAAGARSLAALEVESESGLQDIWGRRKDRVWRARVGAADRFRERDARVRSGIGWGNRPVARSSSFSKGLLHQADGVADPGAFAGLLSALRAGDQGAFERIPLGGFVKLANPQAAFSYELIGPDASQLGAPPPPTADGAEQAGEVVELYWQALARDVPFADYDSSPVIERAARDLSRFPALPAPRRSGSVTPSVIFRAGFEGEFIGPYLSQFLWLPIPMRPFSLEQRMRTVARSRRYMDEYEAWLRTQNGQLSDVSAFDPEPRFIRNGRDLAEYVHRDYSFQGFQGACLTALYLGALPDGGSPYKHSRTQSAFVTFGQPFLLYAIAVAAQIALRVAWTDKWLVHLRARPEELCGREEARQRRVGEGFSIHSSLESSVGLEETRRWQGNGLLAQAYPEGCPTHPSYPAGHAVIAGACATVLKAVLDENFVIPQPVVASSDGRELVQLDGVRLTVGGEIDKLAANLAFGRNFAGVHWRSDSVAGLHLGEEVAIGLLDELAGSGNELFEGYSLRRFDGIRTGVA